MTRRTVAFLFALSTMALGQVNKANLTGVVRDSSGGIVAGAVVRLVDLGTQAARTEPTGADGIYRFLLVDLGTYRLEVAQPGFKKFSRSGVQLNAGETTTTDVTLELGEITETVNVQGEASILRTETGSVGTTVTQRTIEQLPLQGRNPYVFLSLSAGIQYNGDPGNLNPWDNDGPSAFASSGSKIRSEFFLDGMPNEKLNLVAFSPSPDAVGEMRVQTNAYDAEYGHTGGAFINVSTKSGNNTYHGEGYNYLQNDALNATPFFTNLNGQKKGLVRKNTFGGSFGGPVFLPKVYNGRNKTFFFVNYEGTRNPSQSQTTITVPTMLERTGDFSKTVDSAGRPITIYDPNTTVTSGASALRSVFPGNVIPTNRWDPVGSWFAQNLYPQPNITPAPNTTNNLFQGRHNTFVWNSVSTRIDEHLNANHQLFFRFGWNHRTDGHDPYFTNNDLGSSGADIFERNNIAGGIGETWIKGSRTVIDFRLGFTRYNDRNGLYCEGIDLGTLGFPASFTKAVQYNVCPTMNFTDTGSIGSQVPNQAHVTQYQPSINLHSIYGRHSLKYGVRYTDEQQSIWSRTQPTFSFTRIFTQGPNPNQASSSAGFSTASLFLGAPATGNARIVSDPANTVKYYATYVQDDWKVSSRLTLNAGLRFEHETGVTDRFNNGISGLDTSVANPLEAAARANYAKSPIPELAVLNVKGGIGFLNHNGAGRENLAMPAVMYAPRFGFAFRAADRVVWRGGWGVFYGPNNMSNFNQLGFSVTTNMVTSIDGNLTPADKLANPFPAGLAQPPGSSAGLLTAVGQSLSGVTAAPIGSVPSFRAPLSQQFSTGLQFALPSGISLETSFVGNRSQRLTINGRNIDDIPDQYLALGNRLNASVPNPFFGVITDPTSTLSRSTTVRQLLQPYPEFTGATVSALPYGRSNYNSLQVQASRRLAQGVMFGIAYTFSKFMEATSYLNSNDASPEHVISDADYPHHLVLSGLWELPFGPGKRLFSSTNPVAKRIAGGWQVSWISTFQSGQALNFPGALRVSDTNADQHIYTNWFDRSQFVVQPAFTLTTTSSRIADIRGPGIKKIDMTLTKSVTISERATMKFQAEFYNMPNHPIFSNPQTSVTNANFTRITGTALSPRNIQLSARISF
jgi:hypothetical protein